MLFTKANEAVKSAQVARALYAKHNDDKALQVVLTTAIDQYASTGSVKGINDCMITWGASGSAYKFCTLYIKEHCNAKRVGQKKGAVKYVAAKKPEQTKACRGKWYTPMHSECKDRQVAQAKRKAEFKMDILSDFSKEVAKVDRYVKDERTTDGERAKAAQAIMHKAQAELLALYA